MPDTADWSDEQDDAEWTDADEAGLDEWEERRGERIAELNED